MNINALKPVVWLAGSKKALQSLPDDVAKSIGYALYLAQLGMKAAQAKPLKGFSGAGVLEIVEDDGGNAYRAIYTVKCKDVLFVLHCMQKKSKSGIATPKTDLDLIKSRLGMARKIYQEMHNDSTPG
ncbi:type II toxin-antitoxin system RelE/ParE family toxin [Acerihabitans sp. TG2]|uniref:type II toxin-antitoxin system RelE/ParE family toxin n=1 Tax=Acerihabitans sp. TG2 TaxID=3096008 RepID=UPI002B2244C4|nr:type II toxin-antitoxin system RelE/ParE family toxin [Acerihabitans sp. TG2]MEA9392867.1 type II toxin-antitoxin system RelE/ParE family toxin [Acerihabitans sp. TG2]